jgi:hypothetical protein
MAKLVILLEKKLKQTIKITKKIKSK